MKFQVRIAEDLWAKIKKQDGSDEALLENMLIESLVIVEGSNADLIRALQKVKVTASEGSAFQVEIGDGLWKKLMSSGSFPKDEDALEGILKIAAHTASGGHVSTAIMDAVRKIVVTKCA